MTTEQLRFAPTILARLGEELVPHPSLGIVELVRNAYDADARSCAVELIDTDAVGGTVIVSDTGDGMTLEDIRKGWLVIGRSRKSVTKPTRLGRLTVGDKGLGRIAALRLGREVVLKSRPRRPKGVEYALTIDWTVFDRADVVDQVALDVRRSKTTKPPGTTIEIRDLRSKLGRREVTRLARALVLLSDPFSSRRQSFRPTLTAPDFEELEQLVSASLFDEAEYRLKAELSENGRATATAYDRRGRVKWKATEEDLPTVYGAPVATFEMWLFLLGGRREFSNRGVTGGVLGQWLKEFGGVHIYHRGLRVSPYGEPGHDWLEMNLKRAKDPELRPSTNNSIGVVHVSDPSEQLLQKTDRSGFIESESFIQLRQFAADCLDWLKRERLRERERRRRVEKAQVEQDRAAARRSAKKIAATLPMQTRVEVEAVIDRLEQAHDRERLALREDLQLYRTLSTVGTTVATFAHEAAKPAAQITRTAKTLLRRVEEVPLRYRERLAQPIRSLERASAALGSYAHFPLTLLRHDKRRATEVSINATVRDMMEMFKGFPALKAIVLEQQLNAEPDKVLATVAAIEAIIANLLNNAVAALTSPQTQLVPEHARIVVVRTAATDAACILSVLDSGPGIQGISLSDIWLPGRTTTPGGTGLGLTIVKDAAEELGGEVAVSPVCELGGAELIITLPLVDRSP